MPGKGHPVSCLVRVYCDPHRVDVSLMSFEVVIRGVQRDDRIDFKKALAEHVCLFDESQVHFANPSLSCGKGLDNGDFGQSSANAAFRRIGRYRATRLFTSESKSKK